MKVVVRSTNEHKKTLGETPKTPQGVLVTPERIVLYALGIVAIGGTFWIAKKYIDSLVQKTEKTNDTPKEPIVIKLEQGNAGAVAQVGTNPNTSTSPSQNVSLPQPTDNQGVTIPPVTSDRYWGGVTAQKDEFPLQKGQGGLRVKALQQAYRKLGYAITNATGYFGDVTLRITRQHFGKDTVSESDFVKLLQQANMKGLEGILSGVENSMVSKFIRG
ncbi:MAG: hypothetical protein RMJ97_06995 [Raineya sp.]|nr:hypothetical protein [Raineya sp.]MDW8296616.1 hypothetical protein [Raineya sp.]